jgi:predicted transcriptional regulator
MARKVRKEAAKKLKEEGLTNRQIAKLTGASPQTIGRGLAAVPNGTENVPNGTHELFAETIGPIEEHVRPLTRRTVGNRSYAARPR